MSAVPYLEDIEAVSEITLGNIDDKGEINISDNDLRVGYKIYNTSPASHSIDINDLGSCNWLAGFYFTAA